MSNPLPLRAGGTPVLLKDSPEMEWPEGERLFYLLAGNGLYLCRDHAFFRSCVPARGGPSALEEQRAFLVPRFPVLPRALFEQAVGFFGRIADRQSSEAAAMLVWDQRAEQVRLVVPEQTATMSRLWYGHRTPIGVHYEPPADLPPDWLPFGDIHSHVHYAAYSSSTDRADEEHAAGLHIVVGRIDEEPPEVHVEAVADGQRFVLRLEDVVEGYESRRTDVPEEWLERVRIAEEGTSYATSYSTSYSTSHGTSDGSAYARGAETRSAPGLGAGTRSRSS